MRLGIMQPYFLPYIGYFQLIRAVDTFVIYDNVQYRKQGWINRNRYLENGADNFFTLPLQKGSTYSNINQRRISDSFEPSCLLDKLKTSYKEAPFFTNMFPLIEEILQFSDKNIAKYVSNSILKISRCLELETNFILATDLPLNHDLKGQERVLNICNYLGANTYINAMNGQRLYDSLDFKKQNISLQFIKPQLIEYEQFDNEFVPWLSIIDLLMFKSKHEVIDSLNAFELVYPDRFK